MTRARTLSYILGSLLSLPWVGAAGCGNSDDGSGHLGDAPPGTPTLSVGAIPMLSTTCGSAPTAVEIPIMNTGDGALVVSAASVTGGFTVVTAVPLTIAAGASATVSVLAPAAVIGTDRGGSTKTGTLTVTTNTATPTHTVDLSATVIGANLAFTNLAGDPMSIDLSASGCTPNPPTESVFLRNTGNVTVTIGQASALTFAVAGSSSAQLPASLASDSLLELSVAVHTIGGPCSGTDMIAFPVTGPVCTTTANSAAMLTAMFDLNSGGSCTCPFS